MDWLKDRKNLPFVITGAVVAIIAYVGLLLHNLGIFPPSAPTSAAAPVTAPPVAALPPTPSRMSAAPALTHRPGPAARAKRIAVGGASPAAAPGAAPVPPKVTVVDETKPVNPAAVHDPFSFATLVSRPPTTAALVLPPMRGLLPSHDIYSGASASRQAHLDASAPTTGFLPSLQAPRQDVPLPRVAGVLYDRGVYAILQPTYGQPQSVKPGDTVSGVGTVTSIQPDGVTIKTTSGTTVQLPVSAGAPPSAPTYPSYPAYPRPGFPGGPGNPYPGAPPGFTPPPGYIPGDPIPTGGPPD